jgi:hypothetical protein
MIQRESSATIGAGSGVSESLGKTNGLNSHGVRVYLWFARKSRCEYPPRKSSTTTGRVEMTRPYTRTFSYPPTGSLPNPISRHEVSVLPPRSAPAVVMPPHYCNAPKVLCLRSLHLSLSRRWIDFFLSMINDPENGGLHSPVVTYNQGLQW